MREFVNFQIADLQAKINSQDEKLNEAITMLEGKVFDNQKETLWKIKECEELLRNRISEIKVNDMFRKFESKTNRELKEQNKTLNEKIEDM